MEENYKKFFEEYEEMNKLENNLKDLENKILEETERRRRRFNLDKSIVNIIKKNFEEAIKKVISEINFFFGRKDEILGNFEDLLKDNYKDMKLKLNTKEREEIKNLLERLLVSKSDFIKLLNKKLEGKLTEKEKKLLIILSFLEKEGTVGSCDQETGEIKINLLNTVNKSGYIGTFMHELTHLFLFNLTPQQVKGAIKKYLTSCNLAKLFNTSIYDFYPKEKKAQLLYFNLLLAVNESLAHISEEFYIVRGPPIYRMYAHKIFPKFFESVYNSIKEASEKKNIRRV